LGGMGDDDPSRRWEAQHLLAIPHRKLDFVVTR
jgi:hypothetical protein